MPRGLAQCVKWKYHSNFFPFSVLPSTFPLRCIFSISYLYFHSLRLVWICGWKCERERGVLLDKISNRRTFPTRPKMNNQRTGCARFYFSVRRDTSMLAIQTRLTTFSKILELKPDYISSVLSKYHRNKSYSEGRADKFPYWRFSNLVRRARGK